MLNMDREPYMSEWTAHEATPEVIISVETWLLLKIGCFWACQQKKSVLTTEINYRNRAGCCSLHVLTYYTKTSNLV